MKVYLRFLAIHLKSAMTYRGSFLLSCLGQLLATVNTFLGICFLLQRFDTLGGYTLPEITLSYAVILIAYTVAKCFARGFDLFSRTLADAGFDRMLVRPRSPLFQVLCQDLRPSSLPGILQGIVMLVYAITAGTVEWTLPKALVLLLMICCGAVIFFGIFLFSATLCFFTVESLEVMNIFTNGVLEYGKYPFGVYGKGVLAVVTFLFPIALTQHWPLQYLLDRGPGWFGLLPVGSLLFLIPCAIFWNFGISRYRSTGS